MALQFIVLLSIMALWALTSLLSREAQPLPPRSATRARGGGPATGVAHRTLAVRTIGERGRND